MFRRLGIQIHSNMQSIWIVFPIVGMCSTFYSFGRLLWWYSDLWALGYEPYFKVAFESNTFSSNDFWYSHLVVLQGMDTNIRKSIGVEEKQA